MPSMAITWQAKTYGFFVPLALFAVAFIFGVVSHRTWAGKCACYGGLLGIVLWALRFIAVISDGIGGWTKNG
jgi:hypothetical protein